MAKKRKKKSRGPYIILIIVLILALLAAGAVIIIKRNADARAAFEAELSENGAALISALTADGETLEPSSLEYRGEYRGSELSVFEEAELAPQTLESQDARLELEFASEPAETLLAVTQEGEKLFSGTLGDFASFAPANSGLYDFELEAVFRSAEGTEARARYIFSVSYDIETHIYLVHESVPQGGSNMLVALNLRDPASLSVSVEYPYEPQVQLDGFNGYAYLPINYLRDAGIYTVSVEYDGRSETLEFSVTETEYEVQHLTVSASTYSSTVGSSTASEEIAEKFYVLNSHFDSNIYWTEPFIQPLEGTITTEYGIKRYTNNAATPSRHAGIDIAAAEGTPIMATNSGVVLFADYLQMTGYTIMIEHGMGLHSIYYHMSGLNCEAGDMVSIGDEIGYVGMTGFATGPHLHFAIMVNNVSISPWYVFDETSGVYDIKDYLN